MMAEIVLLKVESKRIKPIARTEDSVKMDCNKDEACKAKEVAEKKFTERDIIGAKRFAIKAQNLYPELDGLSQFVATLDVYISAQKGTDGEVDWYRVLGVQPSADDDTIRKHYLKLALVLHPDKNKSVGAEGAFKILSEAWSWLSNDKKKFAYDQKRNSRDINRKIPNSKPAVPTGQNGFHNFNNRNPRTQKSFMHPKPSTSTFWTICNSCKTQFEYLKEYLNHTLKCQNCRQTFLAIEVPHPPISGNCSSTICTPRMQGQKTAQHTSTEYQYASEKKSVSATNMGTAVRVGSFSCSGNVGSVLGAASSTAQAENLKRKHNEALIASVREGFFLMKTHTSKQTGTSLESGFSNAASGSALKGDGLKKKIRIDEPSVHNFGREMENKMSYGNGGAAGMRRAFASRYHKPSSTREMPQLEIRNILTEKARRSISGKVNEWNSMEAVSKSLEDNMENRKKDMQKVAVSNVNADTNKCQEFLGTILSNESSAAPFDDNPDKKISDPSSMSVPDPDFHDFDKDRTEKSFGDNQVWAAYDDDDGMPRYYAMIYSVISRKPFKMQISWLNSKSNREFAPLNWIDSGYYKTSGDFWIGKHEINKSLNSFSHKVKWTKGTRGSVQIYPMKGDVWALYRNWSPDWSELTSNEVIHKYDMMEVLEDYDKERGVTVIPLVKVAGFTAVFRRHSDHNRTKIIPRGEMFRFSHQVPAHLLTGQEGHNAPKNCLELDPASMPLELLRVLTEVQLEQMAKTTEKSMEKDPFGNAETLKEEELVQNGKTTKEKNVVEDDAAREDAEGAKKDEGKHKNEDKLLVYKRRRYREQKQKL